METNFDKIISRKTNTQEVPTKKNEPLVIRIPKFSLKMGSQVYRSFLHGEGTKILLKDFNIYELGNLTEEEDNSVIYKDHNFKLEKRGSFLELEKIILDRNYDNIVNIQKNALDILARKEENLTNKIKGIEETLKDNSKLKNFLEEYILGNRVNKNNSNTLLNKSKELKKNKKENYEISFEDKKDVYAKNAFFSEFNEFRGLLINNKKMYFMKSNNLENTLLMPSEKINSFCEKYNRYFDLTIEKKIKDNLVEKTELINRLGHLIDLSTPINKKINYKNGFGYELINENESIVYKKVPRFVIKSKGEYYLFRETKIGIPVKRKDNQIKFENKIIKEKDYSHPFGSSGTRNMHDCGVKIKGSVSTNNYRDLSAKIKNSLEVYYNFFTSASNFDSKYLQGGNWSAEKISEAKADRLQRKGVNGAY